MTLQRRTELVRSEGLSRGKQLRRTPSMPRRAQIAPASREQRRKVEGALCLRCAGDASTGPADPAHLVPRSLGSGDDTLDVVPLSRLCHREYDDGRLSLLEYLEPRYREEVAQAVRHVGLVRALEQLTNERWAPVREAA